MEHAQDDFRFSNKTDLSTRAKREIVMRCDDFCSILYERSRCIDVIRIWVAGQQRSKQHLSSKYRVSESSLDRENNALETDTQNSLA